MASGTQFTVVHYPESDGKPMGESDVHRDAMIRHIELLQYLFRGQRVYVSGDLLVYYEQGNVGRHLAPDGFVVFGVPGHDRETFRTWEEGAVPSVDGGAEGVAVWVAPVVVGVGETSARPGTGSRRRRCEPGGGGLPYFAAAARKPASVISARCDNSASVSHLTKAVPDMKVELNAPCSIYSFHSGVARTLVSRST